jgi:hypothetical protein
MKNLKYISLLLIAFTFLVSCDDEASIQKFYVDSEENSNYLMLDIPTSIITLPESASAEAKQAYESINKVNLLAFKINESNKADYQKEKAKVKKILKNDVYTELMRMNSNGTKIVAKYIGTEDSIEEMILYAQDNNQGFALARVLGENMKPENMISLLNSIQNIDKDSEIFSQVEKFFK